jgi:hypothetical protein
MALEESTLYLIFNTSVQGDYYLKTLRLEVSSYLREIPPLPTVTDTPATTANISKLPLSIPSQKRQEVSEYYP